jgi:hypothetical protein
LQFSTSTSRPPADNNEADGAARRR